MTLQRRTLLTLSTILLMMGGLFFSIWQLQLAEAESSHSRVSHNESLSLADELRQSSDDLTRMVRTYTLTADPLYKQYFNEILAIRNGELARPHNYQRIYWDLVLPGKSRPQLAGASLSLHERMLRAGFSPAELQKLVDAQAASDALVNLENRAFALMEGLYPNEQGEYSIVGPPNQELARQLVHGRKYHDAKAEIMQHINVFIALLEERTHRQVEDSEQKVARYISFMALMIVLCIVVVMVNFFYLRRHVVAPIVRLAAVAKEIKRGNTQVRANIPGNSEVAYLNRAFNSLVNRGLANIARLNEEIGERTRAQEALKATHQELDETNLAIVARQQSIVALTAIQEELKNSTLDIADANRKLALAHKNSEQISAAKSEFFANMSHELLTPMNAILGFVDLANSSPKLDPSLKDDMSRALSATKALHKQLAGLLTFSQLQSHNEKVETCVFHLERELNKVIREVKPALNEKGLALSVDLDASLSSCYKGDAIKIRKIITELLDNAIKFSRQGEITILIEELDEDNNFHFSITDQGKGIAEHEQKHLFDEFYQGDGSTIRQQGGVGMGTSICKGLVEVLDGKLWFSSELGRGSTFEFCIPLTKTECSVEVLEKIVNDSAEHEETVVEPVELKSITRADVGQKLQLIQAMLEENGHPETELEELRLCHHQLDPVVFAALVQAVDNFDLLSALEQVNILNEGFDPSR